VWFKNGQRPNGQKTILHLKLELTFREVPQGTEILMVHSNVPKEQADEIAEGWIEFYWNPLKEYFSNQSKV
jgi:hypothetical protein